MHLRTLPARALLMAGAALLVIASAASAQATYSSSVAPPAPPAPPEPPAPPSPPEPPEPPAFDPTAIDHEVADAMAEARQSIAEARQEIAEARKEVLRETDMPAADRTRALAALDKAEHDVARALSGLRD